MSKAGDTEQIQKAFEKDMQPSIDAVMQAYKTASENENKTTYSYILLGKALLNCRKVLGSAFKDHITFELTGIPDKQVKRYMRFIACPSCYEYLSKKPNSTDQKKLKVDTYIDGIKEDDLKTLKEPSMNKLARMKEMFYIKPDAKKDKVKLEEEIKQAKDDFEKVIKGDDTKYDETIKKEKDDKEAADKKVKAKNEKELKAEFLKTGLTKEEYELYKAGGDPALEKIQKVKIKLEWQTNQTAIRERKITALRMELISKEEEISELKKPKDDDESKDAA